MLGQTKKYSPKWWFDGDLPWYKVKSHLQQTQAHGSIETKPFQIAYVVTEDFRKVEGSSS